MIEAQNLTKDFGVIRAVDGVSFQLEKGEILGFLGPNGAGKSTTMKMLTGFLAPSTGEAFVGGYSILENPERVKNLIGYLPETSASYPEMNVTEFLTFIAEVRGFRGAVLVSKVEDVIIRCFLESVRYQPIDTLSKGFRQRVGFAQAIIHDPPVLVLDEPTDGLDPNQKHEVRNLIRAMGQDKAIILSTHILEEVDAVCSRVMIISEGKVVADGTPQEIRSKSELYNVVEVGIPQVDPELAMDKIRQLSVVESVERVAVVGDSVQKFRIFPKKKENIVSPLSDMVRKEGWAIEALHQNEGRLDEVFRTLTSREVQE